ncbi:MAG: carbohydrate ABC transporter permease [Oscillospiraceae bacterium]
MKWVIVFMGLWQVGSSLLLTLAAVQGVPRELYEAAGLDGAGNVRQFLSITIPLVSPVLFFNLITSIISSLQVFTQSYVLTDGSYKPNNAALMMSNYLYQKGFADFEMGYACALGWIIFVIVIFFSALVFRSSALFVFYEGEVRKGEKKHKNHKQSYYLCAACFDRYCFCAPFLFMFSMSLCIRCNKCKRDIHLDPA